MPWRDYALEVVIDYTPPSPVLESVADISVAAESGDVSIDSEDEE